MDTVYWLAGLLLPLTALGLTIRSEYKKAIENKESYSIIGGAFIVFVLTAVIFIIQNVQQDEQKSRDLQVQSIVTDLKTESDKLAGRIASISKTIESTETKVIASVSTIEAVLDTLDDVLTRSRELIETNQEQNIILREQLRSELAQIVWLTQETDTGSTVVNNELIRTIDVKFKNTGERIAKDFNIRYVILLSTESPATTQSIVFVKGEAEKSDLETGGRREFYLQATKVELWPLVEEALILMNYTYVDDSNMFAGSNQYEEQYYNSTAPAGRQFVQRVTSDTSPYYKIIEESNLSMYKSSKPR